MQVFKCIACNSEGRSGEFEVSGVDGRKYSVTSCSECGTATVYPRPSTEQLRDFYSDYDGLVKSNVLESQSKKTFLDVNKAPIEDCVWRLRWFLKRIGGSTKQKLSYVDVGCGYGFSVEAGKRIGWTSKGVDWDATAVSLGVTHMELDLDQMSVEVLAVSDMAETFDVCSEWQVLEHVENVSEHLTAIRSLLRGGGHFVFSVPNWGGGICEVERKGLVYDKTTRAPKLFYKGRVEVRTSPNRI